MNKSENIIFSINNILEDKEVWDDSNLKKKHKKLTPEQKAKAKTRAKTHGRKYPNLIDNMYAAENY